MQAFYTFATNKNPWMGRLPICLLETTVTSLMGHPFFTDHNMLHACSSILFGCCFSLAFDTIKCPLPNAQGPLPSTNEVAGPIASMCEAFKISYLTKTIPFKSAVKLFLSIPCLLMGFRVVSSILQPYFPSQHDLSLQCGVIQLLILAIIECITLRTKLEVQKNSLSKGSQNIPKLERSKAKAPKRRDRLPHSEQIKELSQQLAAQGKELEKITSQLQEKTQKAEVANEQIKELSQTLATQEEKLEKITSQLQEKTQEAEVTNKWVDELLEILKKSGKADEQVITLSQTLAMQKENLKNAMQEAETAKKRARELSQTLATQEQDFKEQLQKALQDKEMVKEEIEVRIHGG